MKKLQIVTLWMACAFFGLNGFAQEAVPVSSSTPANQKANKEFCKDDSECQSNLCAIHVVFDQQKNKRVLPDARFKCVPAGTPKCAIENGKVKQERGDCFLRALEKSAN